MSNPFPLTCADIDQIIEGITEFIISGDAEIEQIWHPYIVKLQAQRRRVSKQERLRATTAD